METLRYTYWNAGKTVDGIRSIREVIGEERVGSRGEVGGLWVCEEVVEGVDDVLNARRQ